LDHLQVIDIKNISKVYKTGEEYLKVLDNISLSVNKGEYLAILGPSGSGKSTLMNILGCLDKPSEGSYFLAGKDINNSTENELADIRKEYIGFIFQKFNLLPKLTAVENVMLPLLYKGFSDIDARNIASERLSNLGLSERMNHKPNELSGGQQQRVAIARALVSNPPLLLADEPTGNLDTKSGIEVMKLFQTLHEMGHTIILITHDPEIAKKVQRVVYIRDGKIYNE